MNTLVRSALDKLIHDETFRSELLTMLEDVNRSATDPALISRAAPPPPPAAETAPAPEKDAMAFADMKDAILKDADFLKALTEALMALNAPAETARAAKTADLEGVIKTLKEEIVKMQNSLTELSATLTEHDAVLVDMAESAVVAESNTPRTAATFRARIAAATPSDVKKPDLADRAAKVLVRMGGK